jgi:hypothetical protein
MKIVIIITFLLIPFFYAEAQQDSDKGIIFDTTIYNFGLVKNGSMAEHIFTFVNKSKTVVVISNVRTYCSCIKTTWTKEPVEPNASGEVKVKYYGKTVGTFSKTVKVFTSISDKSVDLTVKGQCQ